MFTNSAKALVTVSFLLSLSLSVAADANDNKTKKDVTKRFRSAATKEIPDFQKHVIPMMSRLGCNGRACHGSFQGRGGFQLSLFGYDFDGDFKALHEKDSDRVITDDPLESLILSKPTDGDDHGGGKRFSEDSWEYNVLRRWLETGAKKHPEHRLASLEVTPKEINFSSVDQQIQLKAIAVWADGTREDVTPLCRFQSNDEQISTIDKNGLVKSGKHGDSHVVVFYDKAVVPIPIIRPFTKKFGDAYPSVKAPTQIDKLVIQKLRKLGITQSELADDATFLRRVSLDITGTLPSPNEITEFLADTSPNKRQKKIDELLDTPAYAAWWATKLNDYTGNSTRQLNNVGANPTVASRQWYQWVYERVQKNVPYDEIVEGIVTATSRKEGESYYDYCQRMSEISRDPSGKKFAECESMPYYWQRREFRNGNARAISFANAFLGIRIQCAQCHKHPFDQWTKNDFKLFAQMFTSINSVRPNRIKEDKADYDRLIKELGIDTKNKKINVRQQIQRKMREGATVPFDQLMVTRAQPVDRRDFNRRRRNRKGRNRYVPLDASILGQEKFDALKVKDPRQDLMKWLRDPKNPYFAKAFVNRVWANYFNVGIIAPTDDLNLANPPSNAALLDYLAQGFIDNDFDMKWLHREITNSRTYQLSWQPNETNRADQRNFSHSIPRRLPAEMVYDALTTATANDRVFESRKTQLASRAIAGASRDRYRFNNRKRLNLNAQFALSIFGISSRDNSCDCDRSMEPSLLQTVFLQNDRDIHLLIDRPTNGWLSGIAAEFAPKDPGGKKIDPRQIQRLAQNLQNVRKKRDRLKKKDPKSKQLAKLNRQLQEGYKRINEMRKRLQDANNPPLTDEQIQRYIRDAYLRTVSRNPTQAEMERCKTYVNNEENKLNGLRGILWALLNTKEFIVNH